MSILYSPILNCSKIERLRNYLAQISEREVESRSSATPSSSWSLEIWGIGAAESAPTYGVISWRASTVDIPDPLSTSPESPILGFWATWSWGELGAATGGGGGRGWGSAATGGGGCWAWCSGAVGSVAIGRRVPAAPTEIFGIGRGSGRRACAGVAGEGGGACAGGEGEGGGACAGGAPAAAVPP
jgi:hypothetical protein